MNKSHNLRGHFAKHPGGQPGGQHPMNAAKQMSHPTHHATGVVAADRALKNKPMSRKKRFSTFPVYGPSDTGPY